MKRKFTAAILLKFKKKLNVTRIPIKKPENNQILVKLKFAGVCKSQIMEIDGKRNNKKWLPHMLGHEGSGVIVSVGPNINDFKIGDRVFLSWIKNNKKDCKDIKFLKNKKIINAGKVTTFNSYSLVSSNRVYHLPKSIDYKVGALIGCAFATGFGMILKSISKRKKINLLIIGLGGIGLSSLIAAISLGYKNIDVLEINQQKLNHIKKHVRHKNVKYFSSLIELKRDYYDNIIESSGNANVLSKSINYIHNKGKVVFASHPEANTKIKLYPHDLIKGKKIVGSWGGNIVFKKDLNSMIKVLKRTLYIKKLFLNKVYSLNEINIAINHLRKGISIRPLIRF